MAKTCRSFQLKLKKSEEKSKNLRAENAKLAEAVNRGRQKPHQILTHTQNTELWKSAAIWATVLVAGYQLLKSKVGN